MFTGLLVFFLLGVVVVLVHKLGHYAVGRWVVGIPPEAIRLVLLSLPQYVALRDGDQWASPLTFEAYLGAYRQHDPDSRYLSVFLSAGLVAQIACVCVVGGFGLAAGVPFVGQSVILISGMLTGFHLFSDLGSTLHVGSPSGDFSALFEHSPQSALAASVAFVITHGLLYAQF